MMSHPPMREEHASDWRSARAEVWHAGPPSSEIRFRLRHMVVTEITGRAARWRADLSLDFEQPGRSRVEVVVDAGSLETGAVERDNHVRSAEFLEIQRFPEMRFRSRDIRGAGAGRFEIVGDLTIRGITREATLIAVARSPLPGPTPAAPVSFSAHMTVRRQDFGLRWNQDFDAGGVVVGDNIDVEINLQATRST